MEIFGAGFGAVSHNKAGDSAGETAEAGADVIVKSFFLVSDFEFVYRGFESDFFSVDDFLNFGISKSFECAELFADAVVRICAKFSGLLFRKFLGGDVLFKKFSDVLSEEFNNFFAVRFFGRGICRCFGAV